MRPHPLDRPVPEKGQKAGRSLITIGARVFPYRTAYLGYLLLYPVPWFIHTAPSTAQFLFSAAAIVMFLVLYFAPYRRNRHYGIPEIVLCALLGFATMWTHGDYVVFNVYASGMAAAIEDRRNRLAILAALQIALLGFCLLTHEAFIEGALGVLFSVITFVGTWLQWELGRRNAQLQEAQHEIHVLAATAERERIARDMHDLLGHSLTVISVKAELARRLFDADRARALCEVSDIERIARTSLADVRHAVSGMNGTSLRHTLDTMLDALSAAGIHATVTGDEALSDEAQSSVLAMALREAVTNVIRHSGARSCQIALAHDTGGRVIAVTVRDDGCARPHNTDDAPAMVEGNGLGGMRARLKAAGGSLTLSRAPTGMILKASLVP